MKLFAFGFGFTALRLVDIYSDEFERISGTVRHAEKRDELHRQKLDAYLFDAVEHSEIASRIKEADVLLVSVPPGRSEDPVLSAFGQQIEASTARQVVYLSTVGVYGDHGGAWIDEDTAVSPMRARLAPMLYDETDHEAAAAMRASIVAKAGRSEAARRKQTTGLTDDGLPVHSFQSLFADLATYARIQATTVLNDKYVFTLHTRPTPIQQRAFELLAVNPDRTQ